MMAAAALAIGMAALAFDEQPMTGFFVERGHTLNALPSGPFLQADLDGDGAMDLLLPDTVAFQREGRFPEGAREPIPGTEERPFADVWQGDLFLFFRDRVERLRWRDGEWETIHEQKMQWPEAFAEAVRDPEFPGVDETTRANPRVRIRRLLHDFDGDGEPAIVAAVPTGLAVIRFQDGAYGPAEVLDVFPPLRLARPPSLTIWPPSERRVAFPARQMACRFYLDGNTVTTIERTENSAQSARYIVARMEVTPDESGALQVVRGEVTTTPPVSHALRPWRLNDGEALDFAGGELAQTRASLIPAPLYSTLASTDAGETVQEIRSLSFRPSVSFVDFNGNGQLDLIAHHIGLFEGGARDVVARALSNRRVDHRIAVHYQEDGRFSRTPSIEGSFTIQLDEPPSRYSAHFQRYQSSELFDLGGDLTGDGLNDAVIQVRPDRLAIYRARGGAFERSPAAEVPIGLDETFVVMDVNGNGRADIVITPRTRPSAGPSPPARVYFTREDGS